MAAASLMDKALCRAFAEPATKALFGFGPERAIAAHRTFLMEGANPSIIIECPLLGSASYDVLVGSYGNTLAPGTRLPDGNPPVCYAAYDWAASLDGERGIDLFFEVDARTPEGQQAGIHCRHRGDVDAAMEFFQVVGEDWRAPLYRDVAQRLPEGWWPEYAAFFAGRPGAPTRLELILFQGAQRLVAESPAYLRSCFDQLGFSAYDDAMLASVSKIAANSRLCTLQFDIDSDGELGKTFSITSCFERMGADFARHFQEDGAIGHICGLYEQMGVADDRWRQAVHALFAVKKQSLLGLGQGEIMLSTPNCGKAKWIDGVPQPAKFYLLVNVLE